MCDVAFKLVWPRVARAAPAPRGGTIDRISSVAQEGTTTEGTGNDVVLSILVEELPS